MPEPTPPLTEGRSSATIGLRSLAPMFLGAFAAVVVRSETQILTDFPDLTSEDIRACLAFAADRERKMVSIPAA